MNYPAEFSEFFGALKGVQGGGRDRWDAHCPAHEDTKPSLSVGVGRNGSLVVRCMSPHRCTTEAILKALGLSFAHLYPPSLRHEEQRVERKFKKSYDYRGRDSKLRFQVCRWEPKSFHQRRPNPAYDPKGPRDKDNNPEFFNTLGEVEYKGVKYPAVEPCLYRLPELAMAVSSKPDRTICVLEGEEDVDLAWNVGVCATCNPMGAGKWLDAYNTDLAGLNVVVVPDEDPVDEAVGFSPGLRHAEQVADALTGVAKSVKVVRLPGVGRKGDFRDWATPHLHKKTTLENGKEIVDRKQNTAVTQKEFAKLVKDAQQWVKGTKLEPRTFPDDQTQTQAEGRAEEVKQELPPEKPSPTPAAEIDRAAALRDALNDLRRVVDAFELRLNGGERKQVNRSLHEWAGGVALGYNDFMQAAKEGITDPGDAALCRNTALYLAAVLVSGVADLNLPKDG